MPTNFCFVIDRVLAGMERPGTHAPLREDLEFLKERGIGAIVSLTESPLDSVLIEEFGFRYLHLPIADFTSPSLEQIGAFVEFQQKAEAKGIPVVVHCGAGFGRTGTLLACALVHRGLSASEAIAGLRTLRPYSIETEDQEQVVKDFEQITRHSN